MRDSFIFYRSFKESISELSDTDKLLMYEAISDYSLDRTEPNLQGFPKALFTLIKPQLEANWKRYEAGVTHGHKGAEHGKKGGRPKKAKEGKNNPVIEKEKPSKNPLSGLQKTLSKPTNVNDNVNDNVNEEYNIGESCDSPSDNSFDIVWGLYEKKGNKKTSLRRWNNLSAHNQKRAKEHIPSYVALTPEKQYRKNFETYLNQEVWNDELPNTQNHENKSSSKGHIAW